MTTTLTDGLTSAPSVTEVRSLLSDLLVEEVAGGRPRHVVVLAVDGLPHHLARRCWPAARTRRLRSVLPTTSSASWLSSLTGLAVAEHGVPGVVFALPQAGCQLINVLSYRGPGLRVTGGNVFTDAAFHGYRPVAIGSDLDSLDCSWRDELLRGAVRVPGHRFYPVTDGDYRVRPPETICAEVRCALDEALAAHGGRGPCLVWCFVEVDQHVHRYGYDAHVRAVLDGLDSLARALSATGMLVVAHADHGLVPTVPDAELGTRLADIQQRFGCAMGGAGRMRWLYPAGSDDGEVEEAVTAAVGHRARVSSAEQVFGAATPLRERVGRVTVTARAADFLTAPDYRYDHGSDQPAELHVPFSVWNRREQPVVRPRNR